jgi:hypothetical protein
MKIGEYEFEGPIDNLEDLEDAPGLCAVVNVTETGACLLVGVRYSTNVRETTALLVTDQSWRERVGPGRLRYGVRYTGTHLEQDLKKAMIDLEGQYLVTCVL